MARKDATIGTLGSKLLCDNQNRRLPMKTILVPVDFSDVTARLIETAQRFAAAFGSRVVLLNVAEPEPDFVGFEAGPPAVRMNVARDFKAERQRLDELKTQLTSSGGEAVALH